MRNIIGLSLITAYLLLSGCNKDDESERFKLLTTPVWTSESILANGVEPAGSWIFLKQFSGDAKFNKDGTGSFGSYTGEWKFNAAETEITIITTAVSLPIITDIVELTSKSLKITTTVNNPLNPLESADVSMTFKAK
ncbi:MAG TPA: hypothetical protein PKX27_02095 [Bacteroidales bacterium]|jgi:hypothetical protein|nr:hypothetical protein [Bacteroidales bacterium]HOX73619.1 hypothetical protein [Bacteroidales bacterium]HPM86747.1 hypothetical protein [Bacteroidales bacterium]HQM68874.1 hypothetical protein [Bacteroidales bacterium]